MAKNTREKTVEDYLRDEVKARGGRCIKMDPSTQGLGIPDRLIVLPGLLAFVETKRPRGGRLSSAQKIWRDMLQRFGLPWYVLKTVQDVDDFLAAWPVLEKDVAR